MKIQYKFIGHLRNAINDLMDASARFEVITAQNTLVVKHDEIDEELSGLLLIGLRCKVDCPYDPNF